MIKKLVSHLGEYKRAAILTPILSALEAIMDVLLPTIMAFIIDQGIEKGDMNAVIKYGLLTFLVAAIALLWVCWPAGLPPRHPPALRATCAMRCMRISSISRSPTSTSTPRLVWSPV